MKHSMVEIKNILGKMKSKLSDTEEHVSDLIK